MMTKTIPGAIVVAWLVMPAAVFGQEDVAPQSRGALTPHERVQWVVDRSVSPGALGVAALSASWQTAVASGDEWGGGWSGFQKRYAARLAQTSLSNSVEAGLGSFWGEDPRYRQSQRSGMWKRTGHALKYVVLSERRKDILRPRGAVSSRCPSPASLKTRGSRRASAARKPRRFAQAPG